MSGTYEKEKVVIGGLVNQADALAKKVLAAYNPSLSYSTNLQNVSKCNTAQLEACAKLVKLKARSDDGNNTKLYRNKDILSDRIILRIESLFEAECSDCKLTYQNTLDSAPLFTCRLCLLGCHNCEKMKQRAANIGEDKPEGFVWICHVCLGKNNLADMSPPPVPRDTSSNEDKEDTTENLETIKEDDEKEEMPMVKGTRESPRRGIDEKKEKNTRKAPKKKVICEMYVRRTCPHGRSGSKLIDGIPCQGNHPKRCYKFCDFGYRNERGCKKGKRCHYWHPKLCKFSLKGKMCEIDGCTYQHLRSLRKIQGDDTEEPPRGTTYRRSAPAGLPPNTSVRRKREGSTSLVPPQETTNQKEMWLPKVSLTSSIGAGAYQPTVQKHARPEDKRKTDEDSFLLKLIESLRAGFQEQINGLRKEIAKEREDRYQPVQIGAPITNQGNLPAETSNPVYRAFPGMAHPHLQAMMAQQQAQANQWFNQSCQTFSS